MQQATFIWSLINLSCCCIVTTGIVDDILSYSFLNDDKDGYLERKTKAFFLFALVEGVSSIVLLGLDDWTILPFILLMVGWFISGFALFHQYQIAFHSNTIDREEKMFKSNLIRGVLWVGRFVCLLCFIIVYK